MENDVFQKIAKENEGLRLNAKKKRTTFLAIGVPLLILSLVLFVSQISLLELDNLTLIGAINVFALLFFISSLVLLALGNLAKTKYQKGVLGQVQEAVEKELYTDLFKNPKSCLPLQMILKPGFFARPDRYRGSNFVQAKHDGIYFDCSDFDLQRRQETRDSKGNTTVSYVTYSKGRMFHFVFERQFQKELMVVEKTRFGTPRGKGLTKCETEYLEFNNKFAVFTSDDQFVFYILTPQIQEKFLDLEKRNNGQFYFALLNNEIYLALENNCAFPQPSLNEPLDEKALRSLGEQFAMPALIIDELGLTKNKYKENAGISINEENASESQENLKSSTN